jgi:serine phosphatase RsbU (regulator of sigma subunit)
VIVRFQSGRLGAIFGLLAAVIAIIIFALGAILVRSAIERNADYQMNLRTAQTYRARLLRLQIDEESGMRGFVATGDRVFLQPYQNALRSFPPTLATLRSSTAALGLPASAIDREGALNDRWLASVARPAIAAGRARVSVAQQLQGKDLVDRFRETDSQVSSELSGASATAEDHTRHLVDDILLGSILSGLVLAGALTWLSSAQNQLGAELESQREAYLEEKRVADALQEAFIQKTLPELARADLHAVYKPAGLEAKVGGDWYDAFELSDNRILFSIGDVAGHGIEAAVVMSRVRQAVLSVGVEERDPAKVLSRANDILLLQDLTMVTAVCGMIDVAHGIVTIANAGHPPAILLHSDGSVEMLSASGPPLGALDKPSYTTASTMVEPGSMLVLYTDGLIEYGRDWEAGEARLLEAVRSVDRRGSVDPAASIMRKIFGDEPPVDDVAILTITFREASTDEAPVSADLASASARPLLDRSVRTLLESVIVAAYARSAVTQLEARSDEVEWAQRKL